MGPVRQGWGDCGVRHEATPSIRGAGASLGLLQPPINRQNVIT